MLKLLFILFSLIFPTLLSAMEFSFKRYNQNPISGASIHVSADGMIEAGDAERLSKLLQENLTDDVERVLFIVNSPGGNLLEGILLGTIISELPQQVSTQVGSFEQPGSSCASACVFFYLGGDYRYISTDARIGIHRFSSPNSEIGSDAALEIGQSVSGIISEYVRSRRVQPELFEKMTVIDKEDIYWLSEKELEDWFVLTRSVYDFDAQYTNINGELALRYSHYSANGDNFLTFLCGDIGLVGIADLAEPPITAFGTFDININGLWMPVSDWELVARKDYRAHIAFLVPTSATSYPSSVTSIGARVVVPSGDIFFGFEQPVTDDKFFEFAKNCDCAREQFRVSKNMDIVGGDLTKLGIRDISFGTCQQICAKDARCRSVSYVVGKQWCWPKYHDQPLKPSRGVNSAVKR